MKKNIILVLLICLMLLGITGCSNNSNNKSKDTKQETKETKKDDSENKGTTMIDDELITIIFYEKTMKGKYPSVHFNVKNNSQKGISIEPLGIINDIEMTGRFVISNSKGQWESPSIAFNPGESYDTYFGYMDNYSQQQLELEKFVNMDLTFYVSEKDDEGGWKHIKDYKVHID